MRDVSCHLLPHIHLGTTEISRKYYIHICMFRNFVFPKIYISATRKYVCGINFPKITYHVFVSDSKNYMERCFGNCFLGTSHFSYMK